MGLEKTASTFKTLRQDLTDLHSKLVQLENQINTLEDDLAKREAPEVKQCQLSLTDMARVVRDLSNLSSQEALVERMLEESLAFLDRAILFVSRDTHLQPSKSVGFPAEMTSGVFLSDPQDSVVRAARKKKIIQIDGDLTEHFRWLEPESSKNRSAVCIPLVLQGEVPAVFYGDSLETIELDSLEMLIQLGILVIQNQYLSHLLQPIDPELDTRWPTLESPKVAGSTDVSISSSPEPVSMVTEEEPEETTEPKDEELPTTQQDVSEAEEESTELSKVTLSEDDSAERDQTQEDKQVDQQAEAERPEAPEEPAVDVELPGEAELIASLEELDQEPESASPTDQPVLETEQIDELEGTVEAPVEEGLPQEEQKAEPFDDETLHSEARRFARLLVTEIKLYNEDELVKGRQAGDLYARLRDDISRSRQMYEKRTHPQVKSKVDYLHMELVRILAQEDGNLMGAGYPGAQVTNGGSESRSDQS